MIKTKIPLPIINGVIWGADPQIAEPMAKRTIPLKLTTLLPNISARLLLSGMHAAAARAYAAETHVKSEPCRSWMIVGAAFPMPT